MTEFIILYATNKINYPIVNPQQWEATRT